MRDFTIYVDSTSDMYTNLREKYNVEYLRMGLVVNGKEIVATLDWDVYNQKQLYDWIRDKVRITTTQVTIEEFTNRFEKDLQNGKDVLYIACSSALSGSVNTGRVVAEELMSKYPDNKIFCVDALNSCFGQTSMAIKASNMRKEGKTAEDAAKEIEETKLNYNQFCTVATLDYLKRAGRVTASKAFFGNIFGVKPIIISDAIGQNYAFKKVKGRRNSLLEIVALVKEAIINPEEQTIFIGHADCLEDAEFVRDHIVKEIPCKDTYIDYIGPIIGSCAGPGGIIVYCYGKKVTIVGEN